MSICPYCRTRNGADQAAPSGNPFGPAGYMICRNCRSRYPTPTGAREPDRELGPSAGAADIAAASGPAEPGGPRAGTAPQARPAPCQMAQAVRPVQAVQAAPGAGTAGERAGLPLAYQVPQAPRTSQPRAGGAHPDRGDAAQAARPARPARQPLPSPGPATPLAAPAPPIVPAAAPAVPAGPATLAAPVAVALSGAAPARPAASGDGRAVSVQAPGATAPGRQVPAAAPATAVEAPAPAGLRTAAPVAPQAAARVAPAAVQALVQAPGARRIGVMISKGGVGKTTTAVSLAAGLAMQGRRVLLVDTDTQGQAAILLGLSPAKGLAELVAGEAEPGQAILPARDNLWLLAGGKGLAGIKRLIDRKDFGGERTLAEALAPLDADYDFIVVDSSPGWDPLTVNVLFYVREILAPLSLEALSLQGLSEFLKSLARVRKYNPEVELKYILPTFLDRRVRHPALILDRLRELHGPHLCPPVRYNAKLSEAPAAGRTIFEFAPSSPGAADYRELVRTVLLDKERDDGGR